MAYDRMPPSKYSFGNFDFGGGANETFHVIGPKGRGARLYDYGVFAIIEVMNGDTLDPTIAVGTPSDADAYGEEFTLSTALAPDNHAVSIRSTYADYEAGIDTYIVDATIPKDQEIMVSCVASTGSNLTGQAIPFVDLIWDW
jgi:hypothetical protein